MERTLIVSSWAKAGPVVKTEVNKTAIRKIVAHTQILYSDLWYSVILIKLEFLNNLYCLVSKNLLLVTRSLVKR
jgi:hypothetical protein